MKCAVVFNPAAAGDLRDDLERAMAGKAIDFEWLETTPEDPGTGQARAAVQDGAELVIACGGDGTVRACAEALVGSGVPLGVVPAGTGNLLARNLGIPTDMVAALDVSVAAQTQTMDTGKIQGETFVVMSGAGRDVDIMEGTSSSAKEHLGSLAYVIEAITHVADDPIEAKIRVDGEWVESNTWAVILIGNLGTLQGGLEVFPDSTPFDGELHFLGLKGEHAAEVVASGIDVVLENSSDRLTRSRGRHLLVEFASPTRYEIDGELRDRTRVLDIRVRPSSLKVCVPTERP